MTVSWNLLLFFLREEVSVVIVFLLDIQAYEFHACQSVFTSNSKNMKFARIAHGMNDYDRTLLYSICQKKNKYLVPIIWFYALLFGLSVCLVQFFFSVLLFVSVPNGQSILFEKSNMCRNLFHVCAAPRIIFLYILISRLSLNISSILYLGM